MIIYELIDRRKALGLTQQQVGERFGSCRGTISNYEIGKRDPSASTLLEWAKALDCDIHLAPLQENG